MHLLSSGHTLQLFQELEVQINFRPSFILTSTRFTDTAVLTQNQFSMTHPTALLRRRVG